MDEDLTPQERVVTLEPAIRAYMDLFQRFPRTVAFATGVIVTAYAFGCRGGAVKIVTGKVIPPAALGEADDAPTT